MTTSEPPPEEPASAAPGGALPGPPSSPPGTLSPDGRWVWNGQQWQPAPAMPPPPGYPPSAYGSPPSPYPTQAPPGYGAPPPPGYPGGGYPGYARPTGPAPGVEFASFLQRAGAVLVDGVIFMVPIIVFIVVISVSAASDSGSGNSAGIAVGVLGLVLTFIAACVYQIVLPAEGGTWGMRMAKIRVARADNGANIGIPMALGRFAVMAVVSFFGFYWLDALWMLWDDRKQTLHDKAVNTYVVRTV